MCSLNHWTNREILFLPMCRVHLDRMCGSVSLSLGLFLDSGCKCNHVRPNKWVWWQKGLLQGHGKETDGLCPVLQAPPKIWQDTLKKPSEEREGIWGSVISLSTISWSADGVCTGCHIIGSLGSRVPGAMYQGHQVVNIFYLMESFHICKTTRKCASNTVI